VDDATTVVAAAVVVLAASSSSEHATTPTASSAPAHAHPANVRPDRFRAVLNIVAPSDPTHRGVQAAM
jgi:hypothetical protein